MSEEKLKWPMVMPVAEPLKPALNISRLPEADRQFVWREIKRERPALAELLMMINFQAFQQDLVKGAAELLPDEVAGLSDEALQRRFGADLIIELEQLPPSVHYLRK